MIFLRIGQSLEQSAVCHLLGQQHAAVPHGCCQSRELPLKQPQSLFGLCSSGCPSRAHFLCTWSRPQVGCCFFVMTMATNKMNSHPQRPHCSLACHLQRPRSLCHWLQCWFWVLSCFMTLVPLRVADSTSDPVEPRKSPNRRIKCVSRTHWGR